MSIAAHRHLISYSDADLQVVMQMLPLQPVYRALSAWYRRQKRPLKVAEIDLFQTNTAGARKITPCAFAIVRVLEENDYGRHF